MDELQPIEHKGIRVLTSDQLVDFYKTNRDTMLRNYTRNKQRYQEGKEYHLVKYGETGYGHFVHNQETRHPFYLWTESGAFLLAKSLNTDKAWEVYRQLVDNYFRIKEAKEALDKISRKELAKMLYDSECEKELALEQKEKVEQEKKLLEGKIEQDQPKVEYADHVNDSVTLSTVEDVALPYDFSAKYLFKVLRIEKICRYNGNGTNIPYKEYIDAGYFKVKQGKHERGKEDKKKHTHLKTFVTGSGKLFVDRLLLRKGYICKEKSIRYTDLNDSRPDVTGLPLLTKDV